MEKTAKEILWDKINQKVIFEYSGKIIIPTSEELNANTLVEAMEEYANQYKEENQRLREALTYSNNQMRRLTEDYPEVCYINPLLLDCIENADKALNK